MVRALDIDWDNQPLGVITDVELSQILCISSSTVCSQRRKRGIPKSTKPKRFNGNIIWEFIPLGLFGDQPIAAALGVNRKTVRAARERIGIESWKPKSRVDWSAADLGTDTDPNISKKFGISSSEVNRRRRESKINAFDNSFSGRVKREGIPLGTMTDADLAKIYGVPQSTVSYARRKNGIPEYTEPCSVCGKPTRIRNPGCIRLCGMCARLIGNERTLHPKESTKLHILRAKGTLLKNLTGEKLTKMKGAKK